MSLAAVYGLEPRGCGRTGTTLFKSHMARLPGEEGLKLVRRWPSPESKAQKP